MASFQTQDYLRREAALGKREEFEQFLKLVPDVPALAGDEADADSKTKKQDVKHVRTQFQGQRVCL